MEEKLSYKKCGDYLIPDIKLMHEEKIPLGKYGRLRREY
ncbi:TnpV protein, partial [Klebsiella variicola]